jgi:hypothetical protein
MLTRYGGTGEINYPEQTKTSTVALQFDTGVSRARERNFDQKSPGFPGCGLMQQASPLLIGKRNLLKRPLVVKRAQEIVETLYSLLNK